MKQATVISLILMICSASAGFFGGMKYSDYQRMQGRGAANRQFPNGANNQMTGRNWSAGRPIIGDVLNKDETSITVKNQDGGSTLIMLTNATTYSKTIEVTVEDVSVGSKVGIFGTTNSDKSITAQNIQLNPQFRMGSGNNQQIPTK